MQTIWSIMREEGTSMSQKDKAAVALGRPRPSRKGQGVGGLYRGWRVGVAGLVGIWGNAFIGNMQFGGEAAAEGPSLHGGKF